MNISLGMWASVLFYFAFLSGFYSEWHWSPESVEELIAEGVGVMLIFLTIVTQKLEELLEKKDG